MFRSRLLSLAARPRSCIAKSPQWVQASLYSPPLLPCVVYRRNKSQVAGEAVRTDAVPGSSSPDSLLGPGANYQLDSKGYKRPSIFMRRNGEWNMIPNLWLRDSCRCSKCVNQDTMQRNVSIFDIPSTVSPVMAKEETNGLRVVWDHEEHESLYTWDFLERYRDIGARMATDTRNRKLWGSEIASEPPTVGYNEVMDGASESGMAKLTENLMRYGLVFVDGTPFDDASHTKKLLERIGPIRETHYGGFYDFIPDMAKADTAYTNIALPAHTDTTYFTDPAGLQAFHMLSHTPSPNEPEGAAASGGESLLVDGFRAAQLLKKEAPTLFDALSNYGVPWHASGNQGVTVTPDELHPVIQLKKPRYSLLRIRWNNDDRGIPPLRLGTKEWPDRYTALRRWYRAANKWNEILKRSSSEYWFQLKPGTVLIFDNYRVLHGRSAFTGLRRICGAYISRDDFVSRWRNTNFPREKVLAQVIG